MDPVQAQYEAYPYPERDPADETRRLITGSPSWPTEMDHWLWGGARDWSRPLRVLVAGGGTGDGLIQLAQVLTTAGRPYQITYLDLSRAARKLAEARAAARGLKNINFVTQSLLDAPDFGEFDYIDCCGVLHHLPEPQEGFDALARALAPGGGIGLMVYAPHGRSGVYPLQSAFNALFRDLPPGEKLAAAKRVFARIPEAHPFKRNTLLVDHEQSDAGFYDLLLHASDRPFTITQLLAALDAAGLEYAGTPEPALYDPADLVGDSAGDAENPMQLAEDLRGTFKTHVVYAVHRGQRVMPPLGQPGAIAHLRGVDVKKLAQSVHKTGEIRLRTGGENVVKSLPRAAGRVIAGIDGRRSLGDIRAALGLDPIAFAAAWGPAERVLAGRGLLHYSRLLA